MAQFDNELAEYRQAKDVLSRWVGTYGPAGEVEAAEARRHAAAFALADAVDASEPTR